MTASYGKTIVTASSHSESKLELKPPAVKNKHRIITSANLWRLWIGYSYLLQYKKKGKWGNFLAQDELYYPWNNFCLAASITQANIISRQVVVMLARMTKMLHCPSLLSFTYSSLFPPQKNPLFSGLWDECSIHKCTFQQLYHPGDSISSSYCQLGS